MKALGLRLAAVALLGLIAGIVLFGPSDEQLIREALEEAVQASREGKPGGVLDSLSRSLTFNDVPVGDRSEIARYVRSSRPDVHVENLSPRIDGSTAVIVSPVTVGLRLGPLTTEQRIESVRMTFRKETGVRWGIVPFPKWRLSAVEVESPLPIEGLPYGT